MHALKSFRVWIVDDDPDERFLMQRALRGGSEQVQVCFFEDGMKIPRALEASSPQEAPHLIISDLKMPGMDGIMLLTWLRQSRWPALPLVILSNSDSSSDVKRALRAGANGYHVKVAGVPEMKGQLTGIVNHWRNETCSLEAPAPAVVLETLKA